MLELWEEDEGDEQFGERRCAIGSCPLTAPSASAGISRFFPSSAIQFRKLTASKQLILSLVAALLSLLLGVLNRELVLPTLPMFLRSSD